MNITKEQADKVIAALSMNRIMARDEKGNYTKEITAQVVVEALSIMRGLADSEPVADRSPEHCERFPFCGCFSGCDDDDTTPQAAQTALKSESSAQAAQAPARLPSEGKPIEALAPTEAQEREAFEAWPRACKEIIDRCVAPDMYPQARALLDLAVLASRAGRKG